MKELLEKLTTYNIFNYLFPGILFIGMMEYLGGYDTIHDSVIFLLFFAYFYGLIISRIGSIIVEPLLKKCRFVKYADYGDYLKASKKDPAINTLLEVNNMYRTLIALLLSMTAVLLSNYCKIQCEWLAEHKHILVIFFLLILFLYSFKKQTSYIVKRVERSKQDE